MGDVFKRRWTKVQAEQHRGVLATASGNWNTWVTVIGQNTCLRCLAKNGSIYAADEIIKDAPPLHDYCRCYIDVLPAMQCGTVSIDGLAGGDYLLMTQGKLPPHYLLKEEAAAQGWRAGKRNMGKVLPGYLIGGDVYDNESGKLPQAPGCIWYEADINYIEGTRGTARVVYSNDGLLFVTYDHFYTFYEIVLY